MSKAITNQQLSQQIDKLLDLNQQLDRRMTDSTQQLGQRITDSTQQLGQRITDSDNKFNEQTDKLFERMEQGFESAQQERTRIQDGISNNMAAIVELSGRIDDYQQEFLMLGRKVDRLEQAIMYVAQKTDVKLKFEL